MLKKPLILFDLGGVLADLGQPARQMQLGISEEAFWKTWLSSPVARAFELGHIGENDFVARFPRELGLRESADSFRRRFARWHLGLYAGADALLEHLRKDCAVALLSNTNRLHWQSITRQSNCFAAFDGVFLSFRLGCCKPASEAFAKVLEATGTPPSDIVFLDDTRANVEAAERLGIVARQVHGLDAVRAALDGLGIAAASAGVPVSDESESG